MINKIITFSVRNKLIIFLGIAVLIIAGIVELKKLPIDAVPDITDNQVQIITTIPNLGATDIEKYVTAPLEQATRNIPGIKQQRSFSRFGLSLLTIVFNDDVNIYWARQQVAEKINEVKEVIPAGMGLPYMAPVTTGLGEIYQYVVKPKKGYEQKYSLTDLRDIQDWIIRRKLLGTKGVADVSTFGGNLKQIEISINPYQLQSLNLSIQDVFQAVEKNNQNTGGGYIEKENNVYFIRTEGLIKNKEDIENILITTQNGTPLLLKNVATVTTGKALKYGATLYNAEGEVTGAVVMMLKGENSKNVIENIKAQIKEIEKSLPEGIAIEAFLDRTKMIDNAITTVEKNLIEGALIVIFVLVIFLGNLRAGLIVASVIPLSMLFAIIMMNIFGVSGNLMSLGAIDFGLLVDGAVIIVEAVIHSFILVKQKKDEDKNEVVIKSASNIMNAAIFGQIIILIVYIPILTLEGIEGKMFKPMAQTVAFALMGAFLLSLTYVPTMCALLSKEIKIFSGTTKFIHYLQNLYSKILSKALNKSKILITTAVILLAISVVILSNMGGEFIPQLEEGDFAVESRLITGSSLTQTISTTTKAADILLKNFTEVEKVVTKIGSGEIPTDPMPLDAADLMVILKPKKEWTNAKTFNELAEKMGNKLKELPELSTGFQFPVQMRFNELMTGAKQDVVCKIFGDDLTLLSQYADQVSNVMKKINGIKDIYVETVTGIPQIIIQYNRVDMAKFGVDVATINAAIQAAYAGAKAGILFEQDKRYDIVVRLDAIDRNNINQFKNLPIKTNNGTIVPLSMLANVKIEEGPYQVQREDGRRRIITGFNVRGRDVKSVVTELEKAIKQKIKLAPGYYITFGGQYENLINATQRLSIVVPIALLFIALLLYIAFNSVQLTLIIFSAIPFAAIGGIMALTLRGMPFSISAGIGFIALFGVAVLNGIVMLAELKKVTFNNNITNYKQLIIKSASNRLRPVLITATAAALGFLPMALSTGAGAEVQKPLATVVIGGLVSSTLLTLIILPLLFMIIKPFKPNSKLTVIIALLLFSSAAFSQPKNVITFTAVKERILQKGKDIQVNKLKEKYQALLIKSAKEIPFAEINTELGSVNSMFFDSKISVLQPLAPIGFHKQNKNYLEQLLQTATTETKITEANLLQATEKIYTNLLWFKALQHIFFSADTILQKAVQAVNAKYNRGDADLLEKLNIENLQQQYQVQAKANQLNLEINSQLLSVLLDTTILFIPQEELTNKKELPDSSLLQQNIYVRYYQQKLKETNALILSEKSKLNPAFTIGYINQSFNGWQQNKAGTEVFINNENRFSSVVAGISVPIFNKPQKNKIAALQQNIAIIDAEKNAIMQKNKLMYIEVLSEIKKQQLQIDYYEQYGKPLVAAIQKNANKNLQLGNINYIEWNTLMQKWLTIQTDYINAMYNYTIATQQLTYLTYNGN